MRHRQWTRNRPGHVGSLYVPPNTSWEDVGHGKCSICEVERRLYKPISNPDIAVCAPCTQACVFSTLSNQDRSAE